MSIRRLQSNLRIFYSSSDDCNNVHKASSSAMPCHGQTSSRGATSVRVRHAARCTLHADPSVGPETGTSPPTSTASFPYMSDYTERPGSASLSGLGASQNEPNIEFVARLEQCRWLAQPAGSNQDLELWAMTCDLSRARPGGHQANQASLTVSVRWTIFGVVRVARRGAVRC